MSNSVFEYQDYKIYVIAWIRSRPNGGHGERKRIATYLRCNNAYITQVLSGSAHLSLEQSEKLNRYLDHSKEEARFFLLLVQKARAGTPSLRDHFAQEIASDLERRQVLSTRLSFRTQLSEQDQVRYYSAWYYAAIHILVSLPGCNTRLGISRYLQLSPTLVDEALDFLIATGLVEQTSAGFRIGPTNMHLGSDSSLISKHHINWRLQTLRAVERDPKAGLHYSSLVTLSRQDMLRVREEMIATIERIRAIVRPSSNEALCSYALDFFEVGEGASTRR